MQRLAISSIKNTIMAFYRYDWARAMDFWSAVKICFRKYATFRERACRSEYWYFYLFYMIIILMAGAIDASIHSNMGVLTSIWSIVALLPILAVSARRLHDIDRTGWWLLLGFIPIIGWIVLLVWFCTRGTAGPNRFGKNPLA